MSLLRLGISLGESSKTYSDVGELIQKVQNATIAAAAGAEITADAVDKIRAGLVRQAWRKKESGISSCTKAIRRIYHV